MDGFNNKLSLISCNWNMTAKQKGDAYFNMARQKELNEEKILKCVDLAIEQYEKTKNKTCLCNLAHCYFVKAKFCLTKEEANNLYKKSIETHIAGSRNMKYRNQEFYRFYSVDSEKLNSILTTIKLSHPTKFNDPVDCPIAQEERTNHLFPDKDVFDGLRVCCFGTVDFSKDQIPFSLDSKKWSYYGGMHTGICIRYSFLSNELENVLSSNFVFNKVDYKTSFSFMRGIVADGLLSKSDQFKEEKEWRIVWYDKNYKNNPFYNTKTNSLLVPINICNIISIYIGYKCSKDITQIIIEFAKQKKDVPLYVYKIHPNPENLFAMVKTQIYP